MELTLIDPWLSELLILQIYNGPIGAATSIQVATATPNFLIQESIGTWDGFHAEVVQEKFDWQNGYIIPNTKHGLGIELNMEVVRANSHCMGKRLHLMMDSKVYNEHAQTS